MNVKKEDTKLRGAPEIIKERARTVTEIAREIIRTLPDNVLRVELDIEYADGGRVKFEARS